MKGIIPTLFIIFLTFQSCAPILIGTAIKQGKKLETETTTLLANKNLTHTFLKSSQNTESSIFNNENEELVFLHAKKLYKYGHQYSQIKNDDFFNELNYYEVVFIKKKMRVEVQRSTAFEVIELLNGNNIFSNNVLNEKSIERFAAKYGTNSISALITGNTQIIVHQTSN